MLEVPSTLSSLIQRHAHAELPAAGEWSLHRSSYVGLRIGRHSGQVAVSDGLLTIADPPEHSTVAITAVQGERWIRLTASTVAVHADPDGFSRWQLRGTVDDGMALHPVEVTMTYHGVRRRGDQAWAWFTGRATAAGSAHRLRRQRPHLSIVLDVLFNAPSSGPPARSFEGVLQSERPDDVPAVLVIAGRR